MYSMVLIGLELRNWADGLLVKAASQSQYRSHMMEHFQLENAHSGIFVAGVVSPKQRIATVTATIDKALGHFDQVPKST